MASERMYKVIYYTSMKAAHLVEMDYRKLFPTKEVVITHEMPALYVSVAIYLNEADLALHKLSFPDHPFIIHEYEGDDHER